jgi:signal transduction histidine kinase
MMLKKPASSGPDTAIRNYPTLLRRYANLLELTHHLTSTLQIEELYAQVVEGTASLLECEVAVLLIPDPANGEMQIVGAYPPDPPVYQKQILPKETSLAGKVLTSENPLLMDLRVKPSTGPIAEYTALAPVHPKSILAVPLKCKGAMLGVIEAVNKSHGEFQPEDFSTLEALAAQAAAVMENLRLFRQSDLIAELVHEIRTPLAALATASALLDRQDLSEGQRHSVLSTFRQEILRLNELADDYLDLARMESGRARLQPERFSAAALLSECAEIISPLVHAQGLYFRQEIARDPLELIADRTKIKQAILNLLTNAVKYNSVEGEVILRAFHSAGTHGEAPEVVCIEVSDTGKGIPNESMPHIFERFYRMQEGTGFARGTGLGLFITRYIAESHHGRIEVKSQVGKGATFTIRLPTASNTRPTGPLPIKTA